MKICEVQLDREVINILRVIQCTVKQLMYFSRGKILLASFWLPIIPFGDLTHMPLITVSLVMKLRVTMNLRSRTGVD